MFPEDVCSHPALGRGASAEFRCFQLFSAVVNLPQQKTQTEVWVIV